MSGNGSFSANLGEWVKNSIQDMEDLHQAIIIELFASVISDTPVLEGRLRGNWIISSDSPANGTVELKDPTGNVTTRNVVDFASKIGKKNFDVYLTNNLPYAYRIEYDGWSGKAPEGMVRKNFIRVLNNLKKNNQI